MSQSKTAFILPAYHEKTDTHFPYTFKLIEQVAQKLESSLLIEDATSDAYKGKSFVKFYQQKINRKPINLLERFFLLLQLCLSGTKVFYIHYSYFSLYFLMLLKPFFDLKIFFWHAELFDKSDFKEMTFFEKIQLRFSLNYAPNLITASETLKQGYSKVFGRDLPTIHVVPNWVEKNKVVINSQDLKKKLSIRKDQKVVLFVHRLSPRKGAHLLPQIYKEITSKKLNTKFLILGNGPLLEDLKKKLNKSDIHFLGGLPQSQIASYFTIADVFMMPSLREGAPRVILESMIYKVPFVSTNVGSVEEMTSELQHPYLVPVGKIDTFCDQVEHLIKSDNSKLIEANYKKVRQEYSLERSTKALLEILSK